MSSLAFGQATRTWVSGVGDDTNPCSRTAPCQTIAGAIAKTAGGGEIDVLDPGGFNYTVLTGEPGTGLLTITNSISIESEGVIAGDQVSATNGITVNAPGAVVVLRGLTFEGLGSSGMSPYGIQLLAAKALYIENCWIDGFETGIQIAPSSGQSRVFVSHTVVRNNSGDGILVNPSNSATVSVTLDDVRTENNGAAGVEAKSRHSARATISVGSSTSADNATGILANGWGTTISLSNVTVFGNVTGLWTQSGGRITSFRNNEILNNLLNGWPTSTVREE
jgi:hypothetical protein